MKVTINIADVDAKFMKYYLLDIRRFILETVNEKINNCKGRIINTYSPKVFDDNEIKEIPADKDDLVKFILLRPYYQKKQVAQEDRGVIEKKIRGKS